ncbi:MAG: DNA-binding protein [Microbacterium sp.]|uniref:DNA-binding protein n=1 Tax=Microbacterium sp. TaxID=51671 RepID=UPI001AC3E80B|nr:DNA-binding protein [Microbacterium sp.]MBN9154480.1 DNA-binding protein [Microbacterium sp.]MBN9182626.1 DNA-binding protein [Microbacterium sp.]
MYVITADQKASRSHADLVPAALKEIEEIARRRLTLPPERSTGDELQTATGDARAVMDIVMHLTRERHWSVGIGVGAVDQPLPRETRAARGEAFVRARDAVERAKSAPGRVAITAGHATDALDTEALMRLLVDLRDRRTPQGWEVADLLATGITQKQVATRLGISPAAVSLRASSAALRIEEGAIPALSRLLGHLDT